MPEARSLLAGDALAGAVHDVRARWRLKHALRGATIAAIAAAVTFALLAVLMRALHYGDGVVLVSRALGVVASAALVWHFVIRPLRRSPDDATVALYVEEHERALGGAFVTAVEVAGRDAGRVAAGGIAARLVRSAVEGIRRAESGRRVDAGGLQQSALAFAAVAAAAALTFVFGPATLRTGMQLLLTPWAGADPGAAFAIRVTPGDATIAKGGDQLVAATLNGFTSERVELLVRSQDAPAWTRLEMAADSSGTWGFRLFDVMAATEYAVEASGIRSPTYTLNVAAIPYVANVDLEYRYPAYTQLPPRQVDSTGDIAALTGSMVRVRISPTVPTSGGRLIVEGGDTLALAPTADGRLLAVLRVTKPGFYKVELEGPDRRPVSASLDYTIDALPDRPPAVAIGRPGRDLRVLSVDEVFADSKAEDDYGVSQLALTYSVNGGPERTVPLFSATARALREVAAGHTFMLEDMKLQPGDQVAYYARATDNNAVSGPGSASTDMYFLTVRPYDMDYRQGQGGGGGGGGGGGQQESPNRLSEQQRQVIAATFNLARDSATLDAKTLAENVATVRLAQQRLKDETAQLAERLVSRGIAASDSGFAKIAQILPRAVAQMDSAERRLVAPTQRSALPNEQRALTELGRAEAVFREIQLQMQQGGGGGGGGGGGANAADLADIFELQQDRMRNQYETVQRGETAEQQRRDSTAASLDEALEKLRQLAARQLQQDQRAQRKADSLGQMGRGGSSGGDAQRQLAQEAEQAARQLERLARERESQQLADAARRLQDAATSMRQSAANGRQGTADSRRALDGLQEARRLLEQERSGQAGRDIQHLREQQRRLAESQRQTQADVNRLNAEQNIRRDSAQRALQSQKNQMAGEVRAMTSQLDRMATETSREQPDVSRTLRGAADTLRTTRLAEQIQASGQVVGSAPPQWMNEFERRVAQEIDDLGRRLEQAAAQAEQGQQRAAGEQNADRMRDLVRGLESVQERVRQLQERRLAQGSGRQGEPQGAQSTQSGQQGQQGGQQGQQGQRGQQGQPTQGQQSGQGQGQQGGQGQDQQSWQGQGQQGGQGQGQQGGQGQGQQGGQGQGQQGGPQQGGRQPGGRMGGANTGGNQVGGGGSVGGYTSRGGVFNPGGGSSDPRAEQQQIQRELQQRLADAEAIRRDLQRQGQDVAPLDRAIEALRTTSTFTSLTDKRAEEMLRREVVEGLKAYEFALRRATGDDAGTRVLLERSGEVPPAFRALVEEYYRSLSRPAPPPKKP